MNAQAGRFVRRWSSRKIALVAYWRSLGWSSKMIARELADGTSDASIRHQVHRWRLPGAVRGQRAMFCVMSHAGAAEVVKAARKQGLTPAEFIGKVAECAARGDLYRAIVDEGR